MENGNLYSILVMQDWGIKTESNILFVLSYLSGLLNSQDYIPSPAPVFFY